MQSEVVGESATKRGQPSPDSSAAAQLSPPKRARTDQPNLEVEWLEDPIASDSSGDYHTKAQITIGNERPFIVRQSDPVYAVTADGQKQVCLVSRFLASEDKIVVQGNWCLDQKDIVGKLGSALTPEAEEFLDLLGPNEILLTNLTDENDISCISGLCKVIYKKPDEDSELHSGAEKVCRYRLRIDDVKKTIDWKELAEPESESDDGKPKAESDVKMEVDELNEAEDNAETAEEETATVGTVLSGSDDEDCDSLSTSRVPIQGEGSNFDGEIRIGAKYQVPVGPFTPNRRIRFRGAKLVHKADAISDEDLTSFLSEVAKLHNEFLAEHKMTMRDPYILLHQERADEFSAHLPPGTPVTGSIMSTASSMGGTRVPLLKECNPDALLELLSSHDYNVRKAIKAIKGDLDAISCGWTQGEKGIFDAGFRIHEGELREIGGVLRPLKSTKDVVDYHYRFKIPEQFRKYQNKKREQALRITECIQTRKYGESLSGVSANPPVPINQGSWNEKSMADATESRQDRLHTARELLLDVKESLGKKKMVAVAGTVRKLQASYDKATRDDLFDLLTGHPHLQKRFLEFLPKFV